MAIELHQAMDAEAVRLKQGRRNAHYRLKK